MANPPTLPSVLHVIDTLGRGGAEHALVNLLPAIKAKGANVHVAMLRGPDTLAGDLEAKGVNVHRFPGFKQWNLRKGARELNRLADRLGVDIIHSHLYFPGLYNAWGVSKNDARVRLTSFHNLAYEADAHRSGWKSKIRKLINRYVLSKGLDASSAVSSAVAEHYGDHLGLREIEVIPNALPTLPDEKPSADAVADLRQKLGIAMDEFFIVCPGRLVLEKGHMDLLEACQLLASSGLNYKLHIIGNGPLEESIRAKVDELGLTEQVTLQQALPQSELFLQVQAADCFVTSSICEGFGLIVAEVMALGCPVIATRVGGIPDIINSDEVGRLVPPSDPEAMSEAILEMSNAPEKTQAMGVAGAKRACITFSSDHIASTWMGYYIDLLSAKRA